MPFRHAHLAKNTCARLLLRLTLILWANIELCVPRWLSENIQQWATKPHQHAAKNTDAETQLTQ